MHKSHFFILLSVALIAFLLIAAQVISGISNFTGIHISGSHGTATPAFVANQQGLGMIAVLEDSSTPIVAVYDGGGVLAIAPTAVGTAVPSFIVDSLGVSNLFEVRDAATPVVWVNNGGQLGVGNWQLFTAQSTIAVTQDSAINPTGTFQPLSSTANRSTATIGNKAAGRILILYNTTNTTITISDTGTIMLGANRALGQYDSLTMFSDGTNWIEIALGNP